MNAVCCRDVHSWVRERPEKGIKKLLEPFSLEQSVHLQAASAAAFLFTAFEKANLERCMNETIQADMMLLLPLSSLYTIKEALHFKLRGRWRCVYTCGVSCHKTFLNPRRPRIEKLLRAPSWYSGTNIWFAFTASYKPGMVRRERRLWSRSSQSEKSCSKTGRFAQFTRVYFWVLDMRKYAGNWTNRREREALPVLSNANIGSALINLPRGNRRDGLTLSREPVRGK